MFGNSSSDFGLRATSNLVFGIGANEKARLDSSGRLLVGTSSARSAFGVTSNLQAEGTDYDGGSINLIVNNNSGAGNSSFINLCRSRGITKGSNTVVQADDSLGAIAWCGADGSDLTSCAASIRAFVDGTPGADDMPGRLVFSTTADGAASPTERMRINQQGTVSISGYGDSDNNYYLISGTASVDAKAALKCIAATTASRTQVAFANPSGIIGAISTSSSTTTYSTSSDYRLKENVVPLTCAADRLNQLQVCRFNFIADPDKTVDGFIAHEVQPVVPEAITGDKDAVDDDGNPVYQGIDQSKLVPLLTAALQEAIGEIESLKARVAALESA